MFCCYDKKATESKDISQFTVSYCEPYKAVKTYHRRMLTNNL